MKNLKSILTIHLLVLLAIGFSKAQSTETKKSVTIGIKAGIGISTFHCNKYKMGYLPGINLGGFMRIGKSRHRGQVELLLSTRGAATNSFISDDKVRTLNLDLPLIYNFKVSKKIYLEIGLQSSLYLSNLKTDSYSGNGIYFDPKNYLFSGFSRFDEFILIGTGLEFKKIEIGIRGLYGLSKNNKFTQTFLIVDPTDPIYQNIVNDKINLHSMSLFATISYKFNSSPWPVP